MYDTNDCYASTSWTEAPQRTQGEYESGYLLPQLMGALARESASMDRCDVPRRGAISPEAERPWAP